jgi:hypothetical protein
MLSDKGICQNLMYHTAPVAQHSVQRIWRWALLFGDLLQAKAFVRFVGCISRQTANASRWAL